MEMLSALNLHQHVNKSTRITNKTSTLIDHIISNASDRISYTDVVLQHYLVFMQFPQNYVVFPVRPIGHS